jgi:hypothetical protein
MPKQNSMFGWGDNPNENSNAFKRTPFRRFYNNDQNFSFMARIGMDNSNDFIYPKKI